jgi:anthranilate phosphoribosyltransferase
LVAAGLAEDFRRAAAIAGDAIYSGEARAKLAELAAFTQAYPPRGQLSSTTSTS